jgi:hypothetical protein
MFVPGRRKSADGAAARARAKWSMVVAFSPFQRAVANLLGSVALGKGYYRRACARIDRDEVVIIDKYQYFDCTAPKIWASFSTHQNLKSVNIGTSRASG